MNYINTNTLNNNIIDQIVAFSTANNYEPFWADEFPGKFNHFHYITENGRLVSFLGIMPLSDDSVEITGMTLPKFRHQGHFSTLLKVALAELDKWNLNIFCEENLHYRFTKSSVEYNDYLMRLPTTNFPAYAPKYNCEILEYAYEYEDFTELIYVLTTNSAPVGLLKIHQQYDTSCIHNVVIRKHFRGQGYGQMLLAGALHSFANKNSHDIILHVTSNNVAAVKLYTNAGFEVIQSLEYYRINYLP